MNTGDFYHEVCPCGRTFSQQSAYSHHKRTCQKARKRLSTALTAARQMWTTQKRRRTTDPTASTTDDGPVLPGLAIGSSMSEGTVQVRGKPM